jgi:hypothetical protein
MALNKDTGRQLNFNGRPPRIDFYQPIIIPALEKASDISPLFPAPRPGLPHCRRPAASGGPCCPEKASAAKQTGVQQDEGGAGGLG